MVYTAPAKINLYLGVTEKRSDGYHEIETVFERISIVDKISVEPTKETTLITSTDPSIPTDNNSLLGRVVSEFKKASKTDLNFKIELEKHIPVGAGLGGGSSDAATLLKGLNEVSGFPLKEDELLYIGKALGADIPFFIKDSSFAIGKGRGDEVKTIETSLKLCQILINPPFEVSTKEVYGKLSAFNLTKNVGLDKIQFAFFDEKGPETIVNNLRNDLQQVVLRDFPALSDVFSQLKTAGSQGVLLSGSGSTVFGIFDKEKAEEALRKLKRFFQRIRAGEFCWLKRTNALKRRRKHLRM
jgi:4-diphosphocytidyl-2-C-methyl-D-erythritol kinase